MKIMHLITGLQIGGAERMLYNLLKHRSLDHTHEVVYFHHGPIADDIAALGIKTWHLKGLVSAYDPLGWWRAYQLIRCIKPDVIHTALWSANIMGRILGKWCNIPVICDLHGDCRHHGWFRNFIERKTISLPTQYLAVATSVKEAFEGTFFRDQVDIPPVTVIPNGIDMVHLTSVSQVATDTLRAELKLLPHHFVIGSVGRLVAIKNYRLLLESFAQCIKQTGQELVLIIVGDGPERASLIQQAALLGITAQVRFVGTRKDVHLFYHLFDCFVLSSDSEGMSMALLEALAAGCPLISTSTTLTHEVIAQGQNGLLVPPNDPQVLAEALCCMIKNEKLRLSMQKNNLQKARDHFDIRQTVKIYDDLYQQIFQK